jgi:hypothetical protein
MMLLLLDDGPHLYASAEEAVQQVEALHTDLIGVAVDDLGCSYRVAWIKPNRYDRFLGFEIGCANGEYRLDVECQLPAKSKAAVAAMVKRWLGEMPAQERSEVELFLARFARG